MTQYKPMLAKHAPEPFSNKNWLFEIKCDGYRAIAYVYLQVTSDMRLRHQRFKRLREDKQPEECTLEQIS